jgi:hypothetical protein
MKKFFDDNKVMFIAILSSLLIVIQQALSNTAMDWIAIGYAAGIAVLGAIANAWHGKGFTILGIIGTVSYAFVDLMQGGHFTWKQFILSAVFALITAVIKPQTADKP